MAINYVPVSRNSPQGASLLSIVEQLRLYQDKLRQIKEMMEQMTDAVDYTAIESQFGLAVGDGVTVYNLVLGANAELTADPSFVNLIDWIVPAVS